MPEARALDPRDWIAGLEKGLAVLQAFDDTTPRMTASAAAQRTGLTRTAARRHLLTLAHLGYLASDGKTFWLTPRVLRLGWRYFDTARLPRMVLPYLQRITGVVNEVAFCAVIDGDEVVYIARTGSSRMQNIGFVLGARAFPTLTSAGMAILSCRPPDEVARWLAGQTLIAHTPHTITDPTRVLGAIAHARALGYAVSEQQLEPGVRGIAVPLKNRYGEVQGALSVSQPFSAESTEAATRRIVPVLTENAHAMINVL